MCLLATPGSAPHDRVRRVASRRRYLSFRARRLYLNGLLTAKRLRTRGPHLNDGHEDEITREWLVESVKFLLTQVPERAPFRRLNF